MRFLDFGELLRYRAETTPSATAILTERDGKAHKISFRELLKDVQTRSAGLRETGKTSAGVFCDGTYETLLDLFGAALAGMQLALFSENPDRAQVEAADVDLLLGEKELAAEFADVPGGGAADGEGRVLMFTSGTTAKNRAVALTQQSLCAAAMNGAALLPLSPDDILMCMLPLDHVFGLVCGLLWGMQCGAATALGRGPRYYFDDLTFFRPTVLPAVPLLMGFLTDRNLLNPELRLVLLGAGDCPPQLPAALKAKGVRVHFGYGLTETSSGVALSLGEDPYAMTVCPEDRVTLAPDGEILVESPACMMQGYYKDPEKTAQALRNGILATGDIGRFDEEGRLYVTGRKKEILLFTDGTKVFLPAYERGLAAVLPGRDFAVIGVGGAAALVLRGDPAEEGRVLRQIAPYMQTLPLGQRIRAVRFVNGPLPRTATGKIKRWELQQKAGTQ
ncbi:MAG: AMP-binding protein [Clostridia bacterium]|nr:AMP-binding protein [Clostridia bacterium]